MERIGVELSLYSGSCAPDLICLFADVFYMVDEDWPEVYRLQRPAV